MLISLVHADPVILAVLKADHENYLWRNQVALPGGHIAPDESPLSAAYRELQEEVGIMPHEVDYMGTLGHFQTIAQKDIEVFVGWWNGRAGQLHYDPREIAKILEFPITELLGIHVSKGFRHRVPDLTELVYPIQDVTVWGVTARIFHYFFEMILDHAESSAGIPTDHQPDDNRRKDHSA